MTANARSAFEEGLALEKSGELDKALVSYLRAQEMSPQDTEIAYRAAAALLQAGYLEEAQSQLRRIVFTEPDNLDARTSLGNCQLLLGDLENAAQNFQDVLDRSPDNRNALFGHATVCLKEGRAEDASPSVERLTSLMPHSPAVLTLQGETQAKTGQGAAAIATYRKALKADPMQPGALLGLSEVLLRRKRYDEVIELTIRANESAPTDPLALELLSDALAGKGELQDALLAAEAALKLHPASQSCLVRMSVLNRKLGHHVQALDNALKAHDLGKEAHDPLNAIGAVLAALKYADEARSVLTGLTAGKGLDAHVRDTARKLVSAASLASSRSEETNSPAGKSAVSERRAAPVQAHAEETVPKGDSAQDAAVETRQTNEKGFSADGNERASSVLGLQRRDLT
ncbi:lipopolysaccharide assembly protein LapB [Roseibium sp. MMSF_3412]|uniref:tetratricopeptide repeat protein n=1 Tax=Roseibium sp. MMSF_3412 TaxID=3046712 RepID=UPI00273EFA5E|nr:tetratricopeptide repeat protein [Roseibium sp. MMSF_3412]